MLFRRRHALALIALLTAAVFFFILSQENDAKDESAIVEREAPAEKPVPLSAYSALPASTTVQLPDLPGVPLPAASEHAIPGEFTLSFDNENAFRAFLASAENSNLRITGVIPELFAVRVSGAAASLAPLLQDGMTVDNNYRMRAPTVPDVDLWQESVLRGFNAGALDFLDVPNAEDRLDWGRGVTIAVLDTGWAGHSAIEEGQVRYLDLLEGNNDGTLSGHGTAVAGLIGSRDPVAPGIAPGSDILAIRVLDQSGQGNAFTLAEGILRAVDEGAQVINLSLGGYGDSRVLRQAVDFAISSGAVVVAASGNDGSSTATYPAAYPDVIGVTAVDANGNRTPFANYGNGIDIAAPGYQLNALWEDDGYVLFDGTSASAPLVSGMVARIIENGYAETPAEIQSLLRARANDTGLPGDDLQYGAGILNAQRIEESLQNGIYDIALADLYPATEQSNGTTFPLLVTFQNRGTAYIPTASVEIEVNGSTSHYRLTGTPANGVESIPIILDESMLRAGKPYEIRAVVQLSDRYVDIRPDNNGGQLRLSTAPVE